MQLVPRRKHPVSVIKTQQVVLSALVTAVRSGNQKAHACVQNVRVVQVLHLVVYKVTRLQVVKHHITITYRKVEVLLHSF